MNEIFTLTKEEKDGTPIDTNNLFTTQFDVIRDTTKVHGLKHEANIITSDFIYSKFDQKEREYVEEQMRSARVAYNLLKTFDEETAERVYQNLTSQPQLMAILRRNVPNNYILKLINNVKEEDEETKNIIEDLKITKKKRRKPRKEEDEDDFEVMEDDEFGDMD